MQVPVQLQAMLNWREYPFLLITLFYVLGLWLAAEAGHLCGAKILFGFLLLSTTLACWSALGPFQYRLRSVFSIWVWLSLLLLGGWRYLSVAEAREAAMGSLDWSSRQSLPVLVLCEEVKTNSGRWQVIGRLLQIGDTVLPEPIRLLLYMEPPQDTLKAGNRMWCITRLQRIPDNPNPEVFNYAAFLRQKGVYFQGYVSAGNGRLLNHRGGDSWASYLFRLRGLCMQRLRRALPEADRLAVGAALVIGNREQMDSGVRNVFSRTGAMHILAVSGLHVALIAWLFGWITGKIRGLKNGMGAGLQLVGVWVYVLLCGAGASVVRAGVMFSWIALGKQLNRPVSIWNSWSGSALFLLLYDPDWFFDVGFQLSYLAVAGIVLFQPPITALWHSRSWLGRYFWDLSAVGLAAQLITSPLTLYQFHQFSFAFLVSGWVAVPLGAAIQLLGVGVILLGDVPFIGEVLGYILQQTIGLLLEALRIIDRIPGQCIEGVGIDAWMVVWLFLLLAILALFTVPASSGVRGWLLAVCLLAGAVGRVVTVEKRARNQRVICYGIRGATALECWRGAEVYTWKKGDSTAIARATEGLHIKYRPMRVYNMDQEEPDWVRLQGAGLWFQGQRIFIWDGENKRTPLPDAKADYWLLRGNPFIPEKGMAGRRPAQGIIIDGSNSTYRVSYYIHWATSRGIPVWNSMEKGAWIQTVPHATK